MLFARFTGTSVALIGLGRFDEAVAAAKKAIHKNPHLPTPYRCLAAALAHLGREEEVRDAVARLLVRASRTAHDGDQQHEQSTAKGHHDFTFRLTSN